MISITGTKKYNDEHVHGEGGNLFVPHCPMDDVFWVKPCERTYIDMIYARIHNKAGEIVCYVPAEELLKAFYDDGYFNHLIMIDIGKITDEWIAYCATRNHPVPAHWKN